MEYIFVVPTNFIDTLLILQEAFETEFDNEIALRSENPTKKAMVMSVLEVTIYNK